MVCTRGVATGDLGGGGWGRMVVGGWWCVVDGWGG